VIEDAIRSALRPDPQLTVSQWADQHRILSTRLAAEAGPYRTSRVPFLKDVMDALSPSHPARRITFMKAAQLGATEAGNNFIAFCINHAPAPILAVWPTVDAARKMSQQRIEPLIEDSPELSALVRPARERDSGNTVFSKSFRNGILIITGANSAVGLRGTPARYAFCDEIDAFPGDVDEEGDPIDLVRVRLTSFGHTAKMFLVSTPTLQGQSRIEREYVASDRRRYFVPCPLCGAYQVLVFGRLQWRADAPETVRYVCEDCSEPFEERHKTEMLAAGEWRATARAKDPGCIGFHINGLYSPLGWLSWVDIVREWEAAKNAPAKLKTFVNTRLGETFAEESEQPDWQRIYERREHWAPGTVPAGVTLLTAAVDVQVNPPRLELHVWGWAEGLESWAIDRIVFEGRADDPKTWAKLERQLRESYTHPSGVELSIDLVAVDTGDQTPIVYGWIGTQDQSRILAIKGRRGYEHNAPVATPTNIALGRHKRAIRLRSVFTDVFKSELYQFLSLVRPTDEEVARNGFPPGYVHVPDYLDAEYCRQLVAERRVQLRNGRSEWRPVHERNEALDCRCYARAALWTMGVAAWKPERWEYVRNERLTPGANQPSPSPRAEKRGGEWVYWPDDLGGPRDWLDLGGREWL
jgi:phage terminase large subunit GpA-like protein